MIEYPDIDRDLAIAFSATARCACFRQAARSLNVNATVLRKQLKKLEAELGDQLFQFQDRAIHLTSFGERLHQELMQKFGNLRPLYSGASECLRIAAPESLVHDILARKLFSFIRKHAALHVELIPLEGSHIAQADVMLWMAEQGSPRPDPGFAMTKPHFVTAIRYCPHMATRYSADSRLPRSSSDLENYMLVQQQINYSISAFAPWNDLINKRLGSVVVSPNSEINKELIRSSACIGLLPGYASKLDKNLRPLTTIFEKTIQRDIWLSTAPLTRNRADVENAVTLILDAFKERQPWFD